MIKNIKSCVTIAIAAYFGLISCATPASIAHSRYGLKVISSKAGYIKSVKLDSTKRMVALSNFIVPLNTDWRYASSANFTGKALYKNPLACMRIEAAEALYRVNEELKQQHLGLKLFDSYRPYSVTMKMWEAVPDDRYAANPAKGSGHNRGAAVDLTLYDLDTGAELCMPTPFDDFTEKAHHSYMQLDSMVLKNRKLLKTVMEKHGFVALDTEWWHYYLPNAAQRFELLDLDFKKMRKLLKQ